MEGASGQLLIGPGLPVMGAALGAFFWSKPQMFRIVALLVIALTGLMVALPAWLTDPSLSLPLFLMHLMLAAGFLTILGHRPNVETSASLCLTLLFLGLGLGFVANRGQAGSIFLCGIFGLLMVTLVRHRRQDLNLPWKAVGILAVGLLSLLVALFTSGPIRIMALLIPPAILWPLLPVQGAFVASVTCLPGTLPPFLAVLLPSLGFYGIITLLPVIPESLLNLLWMLAIASALYGSLLALNQNSMESLVAYAYMALGAILWWYVSATHSMGPGAVVYFGGLSLVICGLLMAHQHIRARFGYLDLTVSHGLARIMPWFSTLFVLLITAAVGLPIFTFFSAFMEMMLGFSSTGAGTLVVILLTWLMASWYFPKLMQQVLFGRLSPSFRAGRDLSLDERCSVIFLLALLVMLGAAPSQWFRAADSTVAIHYLPLDMAQDERWTP